MLTISSFLLTALIGSLVVWLFYDQLKWKQKPPGPRGLPIIGSMHQLGSGSKGPLKTIQEWTEIYGDVLSFNLGQYRVVVLSGYDTIKEAYSMWDFSGRQLLQPFHVIAGGQKRGLLLSEGQAWTEQRRFALRTLRDFGFGKKSMESLMQEDVTELIENFKENQAKPMVPNRKFGTAVFKSLWNIIAGERFSYGDPRFQTVMDGISSVVGSASIAGPVFFLPWLTSLFPQRTGWSEFQKSILRAKQFIYGYIVEHQKTFQRDNIRDYIDVYLKEIEETKDPNSSFYKETGEGHLLVGTLNLFAAGSETSSNTLAWTLLYLTKHPEIQHSLYAEICSVIGTSRLPSLEDRDACIYAWAVMEEVFRLSSLIPFGIFHNTMNDVTFKGYFIPKDTLIMSNLYGVHYNKKVWGDPEEFRPERFLKVENGKFVKNQNAGICIPFSVGKRACLGEVLARNNFFLYLTSLVQKFEFKPTGKSLNIEAHPGFIRTPKEFEIIAKERL